MSSRRMSSSSCGLHGCSSNSSIDPEARASIMSRSLITIVDETMLNEMYEGDSLQAKITSLIEKEAVVIIGWSHCPYCLDVRETLAHEVGVQVHVVETDEYSQEKEIQRVVQQITHTTQMPYCFIMGKSIGGCDDVRMLQASGDLENMLADKIQKTMTNTASMLNDNDNVVQLPPVDRGNAVLPLFWFPPTVNHNVIRVSGVLSCLTAVTSVVLVFFYPIYGQWIAAYLFGDFVCRFFAGSSISIIGQVATLVTCTIPPDFRPGAPKQFACFCGCMFSLLMTVFFFSGLTIVGAIFGGMLAMAAGMEGFGDFCLGCLVFGKCIRYGWVPPYIYHVHTASRPELMHTSKQMSYTRNKATPVKTKTDPESKIGLEYKVKRDAWMRNDFDPIRNVQAEYFGMPASLAGLATAFKLASDWGRSDLVDDVITGYMLSVSTWWSGVFGILGAIWFAVLLILYGIRSIRYPQKCVHEWDCPLRSCHFGYISTSLVLFSFLIYNWNGPLGLNASEWTGRCLLWAGAVSHSILVIAKIGEFVGFLHDLEHIYTSWLILTIGSMLTAFVAPLIPMLANSTTEANVLLAQFFYSFALLMWVTFFVITFLKVVTTPNSNNAQRNSIFLWITAPCTVGLASYSICIASGSNQCSMDLAQYYFVGIMMFLCLAWATLPYVQFFGRDPFSMTYWSECFAFGMLAACATLFYGTNGYQSIKILALMALTVAAVTNTLALLQTLTAIRRRKAFTPTPKWGPLAFMKCTHEGIRGAIPKLRAALEQVNLLDTSNRSLNKFASLFAQFKLVHQEHSRHENDVIFKTFNEYFPSHCAKYLQEHSEDEAKLARWSRMIGTLLDPSAAASEKDTAFEHLTYNVPEFLDAELEHLQGEEDHLQPIGKKYIPTALQKQMVKECFHMTSGDRWEVMLPFIINNCPHHMQRIRYLKCLCWAMPERSQQFGAIVYRHVDAVMWERLRIELPEIIPRGERSWRRYY